MPRRDPIVAAFTRTRVDQVFREAGETMQAFAGRAGLSTPALSRMLSGARTPGRDSIERIARATGRSPGWFYPPVSGYSVDLEFLRTDDADVETALRTLRADPRRTLALKRLFRAAALSLAELDLPAGAGGPEPGAGHGAAVVTRGTQPPVVATPSPARYYPRPGKRRPRS